MFAHRSIYHDGWRAVCPFPGTSFAEAGVGFGELDSPRTSCASSTPTGWELYHVDEDSAETKNLAEQQRDKLIEMIALWYAEAGKYNVLPLDSRGTHALRRRASADSPRRASTYVYYPGTRRRCRRTSRAKVLNRAHSITADVELEGRRRGRAACHGSNVGGYALFVQDGKLHYVHNYVGAEEFRGVLRQPVPAGKHALRYEFEPTGAPDLKAGQGHAGRRASSSSTASWSGRRISR